MIVEKFESTCSTLCSLLFFPSTAPSTHFFFYSFIRSLARSLVFIFGWCWCCSCYICWSLLFAVNFSMTSLFRRRRRFLSLLYQHIYIHIFVCCHTRRLDIISDSNGCVHHTHSLLIPLTRAFMALCVAAFYVYCYVECTVFCHKCILKSS